MAVSPPSGACPTLSSDLFAAILSHIPSAKDKLRAAACCRAFRAGAQQPLAWSNTVVSRPAKGRSERSVVITPEEVVRLVQAYGSEMKSLAIFDQGSKRQKGLVTVPLLRAIRDHCSGKLRSLQLHGVLYREARRNAKREVGLMETARAVARACDGGMLDVFGCNLLGPRNTTIASGLARELTTTTCSHCDSSLFLSPPPSLPRPLPGKEINKCKYDDCSLGMCEDCCDEHVNTSP